MNARIMLAALLSAALILSAYPAADARPGGGFGGGGRGGGGGARMGGGGGGGMRMGGGGGGGARMGSMGGGARPMPRPSSVPNFSSGGGGGRPSFGSGGGGARPSVGSRQSFTPQQRPSGGLRPSVQPGGGGFPGGGPGAGGRPVTRPNIVGGGGAGTRPGGGLPGAGGGGTRPGFAGGGTRPGFGSGSTPDLGGGWSGGNRPAITMPGAGTGQRPGGGAGARPGGGDIARPGRPGGTRPGGGGRPDAGDLGDFLGMTRPVRPGGDGASTLPARPGGGTITRPDTRPGQGGAGEQWRPGRGTRPGQGGGGEQWRPGGGRPGGWAGGIDRPIHQRPNWVNINNNVINNIHNNWTGVINRPGRPGTRPWYRPRPGWNHWSNWGAGVRNHWHNVHWHNNWFDGNWWNNHIHRWPGWFYGWGWNNVGWRTWWTVPVWTSFAGWFNTGAAANWSQPIFYDYSDGGNVVYQDNSVYIGGEQVATADEFAQSAAALATVDPPATEQEAEAAEWMPLGTFAVSTNQKDTDPTRILQLAVDRQGIISGTMVNTVTEDTQPVQGQVDKETQRVAFRIGDNQDVVAETGLYNLTQNEVPLLVHYGPDRRENYLLVRLDAPPEEEGKGQADAASSGSATVPGGAGDPFGGP